MNEHKKIKVNYLIGHKTEIYMDNKVPCGERRFYNSQFWNSLEESAIPNYIHLYKPFRLNIPFMQSLPNIAYHFNNAITAKKNIDKTAISHIFFEEESSILRLIPVSKSVVTVLDIIPIAFSQDNNNYYRFFYQNCVAGLKKATRVLTISEHTKKDLVKYLDIPPEIIKTTYLGLSDNFKIKDVPHHIYSKYKLNPKKLYLMGASGLGIPRKNLEIIIDTLPQIRKTIPNMEVIITGYKANNKNNIKEYISKLKLENVVHLLEKVPDEDLVLLYNLADIFIYPSLYEGFGLPIIEAMACGTPVIAGNNSSLPEAAGNAGIFIDPRNKDELCANVIKITRNKGIQKHMIEKGLHHVKKFTWQECARKVLETYYELNDLP